MPQTPNMGYTIPVTGTESGTWGDDINNNFTGVVDNNIGGIVTLSLSNTNVNLSPTQAQNGILRLTGILTTSVIVTTTRVGYFYVENLTTGNFTVTLSNGAGSSAIIPQSSRVDILSDATNGVRSVGMGFQPGDIKTTMQNTAANLGGEWLWCDGSAYLVATYPLLAAIMGNAVGGSFTVPDFRGRVPAGRDNMNGTPAGRLTAANGFDGTILNNGGGEQVHTLLTAEIPSNIGTATVTDPGHHHTSSIVSGGSGISSGGGGIGNTSTVTGTSTTGITVSIQNPSGDNAHNNVQPTLICNVLIKT